MADEYLGKGIALLQQVLQDPEQASTDEALGSVYLLGLYEVSALYESETDTDRALDLVINSRGKMLPGTQGWRKCLAAITFLEGVSQQPHLGAVV